MSETPFVAFGPEDLGELIGSTIKCPHCGEEHEVLYCKKVMDDRTLVDSNLLAYYKCAVDGEEKSYICAIDKQRVF